MYNVFDENKTIGGSGLPKRDTDKGLKQISDPNSLGLQYCSKEVRQKYRENFAKENNKRNSK